MPGLKFGPLKTVYRGHIFTIKKRSVILPTGTKATFEYCARPASVSVLAFNKKNELLMIREYRDPNKKWSWFLPGGRMDSSDETPKKAVLRELREESGYAATTIKLIHKKISPSTTFIWDSYLFAAKNLIKSPLPKDPGERIKTVFVPLKKAVALALAGKIENQFIAYNIIRFDQMIKNKEFKW